MTKTELEKENQSIKEQLADLSYEAWRNGLFLVNEPFIPEYLGFEEQKIEDKDGVLCRIYTSEGFSLSRYVSSEKKEWIIVDPNRVKTEIVIDSMEFGIKVLQGLKFPTSIEMYYRHTSPEAFGIDVPIADFGAEA